MSKNLQTLEHQPGKFRRNETRMFCVRDTKLRLTAQAVNNSRSAHQTPAFQQVAFNQDYPSGIPTTTAATLSAKRSTIVSLTIIAKPKFQ